MGQASAHSLAGCLCLRSSWSCSWAVSWGCGFNWRLKRAGAWAVGGLLPSSVTWWLADFSLSREHSSGLPWSPAADFLEGEESDSKWWAHTGGCSPFLSVSFRSNTTLLPQYSLQRSKSVRPAHTEGEEGTQGHEYRRWDTWGLS